MKTLYYTVEKELQQVGDIEETTGIKTITVYDILDSEIATIVSFEIENDENSKDAINGYLVDNGFEENEFSLIKL